MRVALGFIALFGMFGTSLGHQAHSLPLGDGKLSQQPARGNVFACQRQFPGVGGAQRTGEWSDVGRRVWHPDHKPVVEGQVFWPNATISVRIVGEQRIIQANNLPLHPTGEFPVRPGSQAYLYDRNPNSVAQQPILLQLPLRPQAAPQPGCLPMGMIGFTLSGAALFSALDGRGQDAPAHEIQDSCSGHPERNNQYHYHDWPPCLSVGSGPGQVVGFALDGYPILSPSRVRGRPVTNGDLDECHGRTGTIRLDGRRITTYYYQFTGESPYSLGCFHGMMSAPPPPMVPPPPRP